jgi:hypothetical protein
MSDPASKDWADNLAQQILVDIREAQQYAQTVLAEHLRMVRGQRNETSRGLAPVIDRYEMAAIADFTEGAQ